MHGSKTAKTAGIYEELSSPIRTVDIPSAGDVLHHPGTSG